MKGITVLLVGSFLLGLMLAIVGPAEATQAWARRYQMQCSACHRSNYEFTDMGRQFLLSGHRLAGDQDEQQEGQFTGLDKMLSYNFKFRYDAEEGKNDTFDMEAFAIYLGGPLTKNSSFFVEQYLHERGGTGTPNTRSKLADAYLQYNWPGQNGAGPYFRLGQFLPYIAQTHGGGARTPVSRAFALDQTVGNGNPYRMRQRGYGFEFGWSGASIHLVAGLVNGTGNETNNAQNTADNNQFKDVYASFIHSFTGGSDLGFFWYHGKYPLSQTSGSNTLNWDDTYDRYGVLGRYSQPNWQIYGGYLIGKNDWGDASTMTVTSDVKNKWITGTLEFFTPSGWTPYLRYDRKDPRDDRANDRTTWSTIGVGHFLDRYLGYKLEYRRSKTDGQASKTFWQLEFDWMY